MNVRAIRNLLFLAGLGAGAFHCSSATERLEEGAVETQTSRLSQRAVDRVIPIRFVNLSPSCAATEAAVDDAVKRANDIWIAAGIQFEVTDIQTVNAPTFAALNHGGSATTYAWSTWASQWVGSATSELGQIDPILINFQPQNIVRSGSNEEWLQIVSSKLDPSTIPVFVPCSDSIASGHANLPWIDNELAPASGDYSHTLHLTQGSLGNLAHELGSFRSCTSCG